MSRAILIAGATGFIGRASALSLIARGHRVEALVRAPSVPRVPSGAMVEIGDALDAVALKNRLTPAHTLVALVGTAHPAPWKKDRFETIDRAAGLAAVQAVQESGARHLIYLSVAQPAPVMRSYINVRAEVEAAIHKARLNATVLRPWYVLGPGHQWPRLLSPIYWVFGSQSATRSSARRLGLLALPEMVEAIARAVENPPTGVRIWDVSTIRAVARGGAL